MALKESTKKEQTNSYELVVSVDADTFEKAINAVYKKQVKNISIQGFRKGKAPRKVIEKMYGSEVFYEDAMQDCYPDALYDAAKEADVKIVKVNGQPFLKAYVTVTFDDELVVHNIRLVEVDGKIMLSMPNKKLKEGVYKDYVHPTNNEFRDKLTEEVLSRYYNS